jgi:DNA-binding response OmpR family regulator
LPVALPTADGCFQEQRCEIGDCGAVSHRQPSRVLVADGHPLIGRLLKRSLQDAGYQVAIETTAERVAATAIRERAQLAIVDADIEPSERFDVLRALRELRHERAIAIIVLCADHAPAVRQRALELGADAFLTKPWDPDKLLELADRLIGRPYPDGPSSRQRIAPTLPAA